MPVSYTHLGRYGDVVGATMDEVVRQQAESGILFNATLVRCMLENGICEVPRFETGFPDFEAIEGGEFSEKLQECYDPVSYTHLYDLEGASEIIDLVLDGPILREQGLLIYEHAKKFDFSAHPRFWQLRSYGSVHFSLFEKRKMHAPVTP